MESFSMDYNDFMSLRRLARMETTGATALLAVLLTSSVSALTPEYTEINECKEILLPSGITLHCPELQDPEKTDCCYNGGVPSCCLMEKQQQSLVMIIALSVIITCCALTVLVVVCCFCPKCLLYNACRAKYTGGGEIITYTKEEEMALNSTMPYEDQTEKSSYSTQTIKIKPIADV